MDSIFNTILQSVIKKFPGFIGHIDELKELPKSLPLNIFPCYRQTLDHITTNCFSLPKVKLQIINYFKFNNRGSYESLNIYKINLLSWWKMQCVHISIIHFNFYFINNNNN